MSFSSISASLIGSSLANAQAVWQLIKTNFADHQARINTLESSFTVIPIGTVVGYGNATPPTGYLLCDGSAVSRSTYLALFNEIGTTYGAGDGISTFNVPDLQGRCVVGAGTGAGLTTRSLGTKSGEETHVLTTPEIPSHTHDPVDPTHQHVWPDTQVSGSGNGWAGGGATGSDPDEFTGTSTAGDFTLQNSGSDAAHENMQPFQVAAFIIKT
jgi:microcystin-dependent protein